MRQPHQLPDRSDLDQLRHQARDLQRAAAAGDLAASERLAAVSPGPTLSAAQLALAREYGFPSWARLKAEVERRSARDPHDHEDTPAAPERYEIRTVESLQELAQVCDVIGAQITPPFTHEDRRCREVAARFAEDQSLMLLVEQQDARGERLTQEDRGEIVGGALAFRPGGRAVTLRMIGLHTQVRRKGLGRRLMAAIELAALRFGASSISLGASDDSRAFYARLGYAGRGTMMHKGLPLPGRFTEARLRKLAAT